MPSLMRKMNIITRCGAMFRAEKLKQTGLADNQHSYIMCLCRNPGISQDALAKRLFINKSNVTRTLASLEAMGYVTRTQSPEDRRVILVYPTQKALDTQPAVRAILKEWREYLTQDLTEDESASLNAALEKLAARAAEYADLSEEALDEGEDKTADGGTGDGDKA